MKNKSLKLLNTVLFAATVLINILANLLPIGIGNTGDVSDKYKNLFTPAPVTFGIWGVIYLLGALFILYGWGVFGLKEKGDETVDAIGKAFAVSCVLNIGWIFAWHYDVIWLSLILMIGLLISVAVTGKRAEKVNNNGLAYLAVNGTFDIYLGWLIAATIANVSVFLVYAKWDRFGLSQTVWTVIVLIIGALIGSLPVLRERRWFATLTVIWAYIGILIRQIGDKGLDGEYPAVIIAAVIGIVIMLIAIVLKAFRAGADMK